MDFKGWWYDEAKRRCEPLTVRDEHTRYVLELRRMKDARSETVRRVFERLFLRYGLPQTIRSDNGSPFAATSALLGLSRLSAWWVALGIDLERGRPGHPQDNGAHERLHRDISLELEGVMGHMLRGHWICGESNLTMSDRTKRSECALRASSTCLPHASIRARPKPWNTLPWAAAK